MLKVLAIHTGWRGLFAYRRIKSERMKKLKIFLKKLLTNDRRFDKISKLSKTTTHQLGRVEKEK